MLPLPPIRLPERAFVWYNKQCGAEQMILTAAQNTGFPAGHFRRRVKLPRSDENRTGSDPPTPRPRNPERRGNEAWGTGKKTRSDGT